MKPEEQRIAIAEGVKIGRLTAIKFAGKSCRSRMSYWEWKCDCGNTKVILASDVSRGHTLSCGCLRKEITSKSKTKHGNAKRGKHSPEYRTWMGMINRCHNPSNPAYEDYGGRGIEVCGLWRVSFPAFIRDMGRKPTPRHSIERIRNSGCYCKENCKWATPKEQANNRRVRRWKKKPLTV